MLFKRAHSVRGHYSARTPGHPVTSSPIHQHTKTRLGLGLVGLRLETRITGNAGSAESVGRAAKNIVALVRSKVGGSTAIKIKETAQRTLLRQLRVGSQRDRR